MLWQKKTVRKKKNREGLYMKKRISKAMALVLALLMLLVVVAGCGKHDMTITTEDKKTGTSSPGGIENIFSVLASGELTVVNNGNTFELYVPNATTILQLTKYVTVAEGIAWIVANDVSMQAQIVNKTVSLKEGVNTFYVYCHNANDTVMENYVLNIHRSGSYLITFEGLSETQTVAEGTFAVQPAGVPVREGYNFDGWDFDFSKPVTAPVNISARWSPKTYMVTYDPNLGSLPVLSQSVTFGTEVTLQIPQRDGFVFADWYVGEECVKSGIWTIASDVTLTARWASNSYTVTFNADGGVFEGAAVVEVSYGSPVVFPVPTKDGYTFGGWYDGETLCFDGTYEYTKDLNLVAKWNERSATLTFFENGGDKNSYTEILAFGTKLPVPQREGYTFGGWFSDEALTQQVTAVPDVSMRLYAWWAEEGKPGEFIYEVSGLVYKITGRVDMASESAVPSYIGGRKTVDMIPRPNPNAGVVIKNDTLEIKIDRTETIEAEFIPYFEGDDVLLSYTSSKPSVAIVDENGKVKGLTRGACVITVKNEASGMSAECIVIVSSALKNEAASLTLNKEHISLKTGESDELKVTYIPEYEDDLKDIFFESDNQEVATVDGKGVITAVGEGNCTVIVKDLYGMIAACVVEVKKSGEIITLSAPENTIAVGWTVELQAVLTPESGKKLVWMSSNEAVLTVEAGVVTAHSEGESRVTVSTEDGDCSASVILTVKSPGIYGAENPITLSVGEKKALDCTLLPVAVDGDRTLTYESDNQEVAVVENGVIRAVSQGTCTVTVSGSDGTQRIEISVTVNE